MKASLKTHYRRARSLRARAGRWLALSLLAGLSGGTTAAVVGLTGAGAAHGDPASVPRTLPGITAASAATVSTTTALTLADPGADTTTDTDTTTDATTDTDSSGSTVGDTLVDAAPATFDVGNQQVSVTFPPGSVSQSFQVRFSTQTVAKSKAAKLKYKSMSVFLNQGVAHTSKVKRHGRLVTTTVYEPNATMKSANGTLNVGLGNVKPGSYTCKVEINYQRTVAFQGVRVTLPFTSTITEPLTVNG